MEADTDEKETEDMRIDDKRGRTSRMIFKDNNGGVDDEKAIIHVNRWDV